MRWTQKSRRMKNHRVHPGFSTGIGEEGAVRMHRDRSRSNQLPPNASACGRLVLLVACCAGILLSAEYARSSGGGSPPIRIAFTSGMFTEVKEGDARAAVKMWSKGIIQDRGIPFDPETRILDGTQAIAEAVRSEQIEALCLLTPEYWALGSEVLSGPVVLSVNEGRITEEYVLLVHRESGIGGVADLRGRSLLFHQNQRMSLAPAWLEVLLIKSGLPRTEELAGHVTHLNKLSQTVLPVFFRKSDACVVTRRGFQTMSELNPQVGRQLKVLASSPELVPTVFCFRKSYVDPAKDKMLAEMSRVHSSPGGQQVLTIFQSEALKVAPVSSLDSALALLNEHRRLVGSGRGARAGTPAMQSSQAGGKRE